MTRNQNSQQLSWTLSDRIAVAGLAITVLASIIGVVSPEIRCSIGLQSEVCFASHSIDVKTFYEQGKNLLKLERYDEALTHFERVIEIDSSNANAWRERGVTLNFLNRQEEAIASFEKALLLNPNDELARQYRKKLLHESKKTIGRFKRF
ncbi:hypothetical protein NUACC21_48650 [Scytonema sp. NUACC21]